jgi:soluble lytic murein transglycosylase-like protein
MEVRALAARVAFSKFKASIIQQESGGRYGIPNAQGSGAVGIGQVMPETAKALAARLGLPYRPNLMRGSHPEARQYQDRITEAALQEAWQAGGGNPAVAAMYYHGGSNRGLWGPKTKSYAAAVMARIGGR